MSLSPSPLEFFVDRSLGRHLLPNALKARGFAVHTLADVYGEFAGQGVEDERWLADAGTNGWIVPFKDARIRYRTTEREALQAHGVRSFCLKSGNLRGQEQADRFVDNLDRIVEASSEPGPFIYGVYADHIEKLWP